MIILALSIQIRPNTDDSFLARPSITKFLILRNDCKVPTFSSLESIPPLMKSAKARKRIQVDSSYKMHSHFSYPGTRHNKLPGRFP